MSTAKKSASKAPLDHLRSRKKPVTKTVWIADDSEVAERYQKAEAEMVMARDFSRDHPLSDAALKEYQDKKEAFEAIEGEMKENATAFKLRSIGRKRFEKLQADYPITAENRAKATEENDGKDPGIEWDPDTFPPVLIAACVVSPVKFEPDDLELDEDGKFQSEAVQEFVDWITGEDWNLSETSSLFEAAWQVNTIRRVVDLGKG